MSFSKRLTTDDAASLFKIAAEAKKLGSYQLANGIFALLFEASLDNNAIQYQVAVSYGYYENWNELKADFDLLQYGGQVYYTLASLSLRYQGEDLCLRIPSPLLDVKTFVFLAQRAKYVEKDVESGGEEKFKCFVYERELERTIDLLKSEVESIAHKYKIDGEGINSLCQKHLHPWTLQGGCADCPFAIEDSTWVYNPDDKLGGIRPTYCLAKSHRIDQQYRLFTPKCRDRLVWYNDSRTAFYLSWGGRKKA